MVDRGRDSARRHPSLQTGRADLPHPAFQSVGSRARGSDSSSHPQAWRPDLRSQPSQLRLVVSAADQPLRALASVLVPLVSPSCFHLPASLRSTVITRFVATTDALTPTRQRRGLFAQRLYQHGWVSLIIAGRLPTIPSPTICVLSGDRPDVSGFCPPRQASSFPSRLAHSHRPNRVHVSLCVETLLRTGRSLPVALHAALLGRSYRSIPHDSSPHRSGLPPLCLPAFSGALGRALRARRRGKPARVQYCRAAGSGVPALPARSISPGIKLIPFKGQEFGILLRTIVIVFASPGHSGRQCGSRQSRARRRESDPVYC